MPALQQPSRTPPPATTAHKASDDPHELKPKLFADPHRPLRTPRQTHSICPAAVAALAANLYAQRPMYPHGPHRARPPAPAPKMIAHLAAKILSSAQPTLRDPCAYAGIMRLSHLRVEYPICLINGCLFVCASAVFVHLVLTVSLDVWTMRAVRAMRQREIAQTRCLREVRAIRTVHPRTLPRAQTLQECVAAPQARDMC